MPAILSFSRSLARVGAGFVLAASSALAFAQGPTADIVKQGEYLARAGDCIACHTQPTGKLFAGGRPMPTP